MSINLNALRVLVHVARQNSMTGAAEALGVTQSAVSKQIAALQTDPGQPLFQRQHKRIEITPFGQKVADLATSSFARIETGLLEMKAAAPDEIRIVMQP
jgi:LysR family glycine cleavage system transcriptional activator